MSEFDNIREDDGTQDEIQYIQNFDKFNIVVGLADTEIDSKNNLESSTAGSIPAESLTNLRWELDHTRAYLYTTIALTDNIEATLGVSDDDYEEFSTTDIDETNGKFGIRWQIGDRQVLRIAAFEVIKPSLASNRTLEPTQVAGFNQFFDDINGTKTTRVGLGYEINVSNNLSLGVELTERELEEPVVLNIGATDETTDFEDRDETFHRAFVHWTPTKSVAISGELVYDLYEAESGGVASSGDIPTEVETSSIPISVRYFSPSGWFGGFTVTAVDQEIEYDPAAPQANGDDNFEVLDLNFGYRLPKRRGSITLSVLNATDEEFMYQDDSYREFRNEPSTGPYFPESTVTIQANLVF